MAPSGGADRRNAASAGGGSNMVLPPAPQPLSHKLRFASRPQTAHKGTGWLSYTHHHHEQRTERQRPRRTRTTPLGGSRPTVGQLIAATSRVFRPGIGPHLSPVR